jgi:hypothetical protein
VLSAQHQLTALAVSVIVIGEAEGFPQTLHLA